MTESSPNWGGQEARLLREANWLALRGHQVLVGCAKNSRLASELERSGNGVRLEAISSWKGPAAFVRLLQICRREKPDIVHTRSSRDALWGGLLRLAKQRVVRSRHLTIPERLPFRRSAIFRFGCDRIVAAAQFIADDLIHRAGVPSNRVDVVGEGVDFGEFYPGNSNGAVRREFNIPDQAVCFGIVAMIRGEKGHRHFVNAAIRVLEKRSDVRFLMAGDGKGSYADNLREKIRRAFPGSDSPFIFAGYREDVPALMDAIDVLVVPSTSEAQTLVIPQAFACGKPVIASQVGGIPEIVETEKNGLLVEPRDEEGLATAIERLANDSPLRASLGREALAFANQSLSFDAKMELLENSYRKALE